MMTRRRKVKTAHVPTVCGCGWRLRKSDGKCSCCEWMKKHNARQGQEEKHHDIRI